MSLQIDETKIEQAIQTHLDDQIQIEIAKEQRKTGKTTDKKTTEIQAMYAFDDFIQSVFGGLKQVQEVGISLATHTAKGIHSSSRSSNVVMQFDPNQKTHWIGSHSILSPMIDANNGNPAVYIKSLTFVVNFLNIDLHHQKFHQWIAQDNGAFKAFFANKLDLESFEFLKKSLLTNVENPKISDKDKQILYPIGNDDYKALFPVYPSSLAHELFIQISDKKFNENNRLARENRSKQNVSQQSYFSIHDLAFVKLGGTKPLNVSVLNNKQGGRNYLLPSLPPEFKGSNVIRIAPSYQSVFESKAIEYYAKDDLQAVFEVVQDIKNNVYVRDKRKKAIDKMIACIFEMAMDIQQNRIAGWSKEYDNLALFEKYWLDPHRAELEDETEFKLARENEDWHNDIAERFAHWLQKILKNKFPAIKHDFGEPEYYEWFREMKDEVKKAIRSETGVF